MENIVIFLIILILGFIAGIVGHWGKSWDKDAPFKEKVKLSAKMILIFIPLALILDFFGVMIGSDKEGESMMPTIQEKEECLVIGYGLKIPFTNKWLLKRKLPKRGDIVTISPFPCSNKVVSRSGMTKRVIGLPKESIMIKDREVYINGVRLYEPYKMHTNKEQSKEDNWEKPLIIPEGHYFVMGDNRDISLDSRKLGCIPEEFIRGKVVFILWPLHRIGNYNLSFP